MKSAIATGLLWTALGLGALPDVAVSGDRGFSTYDGDTFRATFRLFGVDTPEIKGACERERDLALRAKHFTKDFLLQGGVVIAQVGTDRYGRILATVRRGELDLGEALMAAGLARKWRGRRESWCE